MKFIRQAISTLEELDVEYEELVLVLTEQLKSHEDLIHVKHWQFPDLYACFIEGGLLFYQNNIDAPLSRWDGILSKELDTRIEAAQRKRGKYSASGSPGNDPKIVAKMLLAGDLELV